jgi:hypothetical protein
MSTNNVRTPVEDAYATYNRMRRAGGYRNLNATDRAWYFFYRTYRNHTKYWRARNKPELLARMPVAVQEAKDWVAKWAGFADWFDSQVPTEVEFQNRHGDINGHEVTHYASGGSSSVARRDQFRYLVQTHTSISNKVWENIDKVQDQLDLVDDGDSDFGAYEEIISFGAEAGLSPLDDLNDRDDGMLWFVDVETEVKYMFDVKTALHSTHRWNNNPWSVMGTIYLDTNNWGNDRWKNYPYIPLNRTFMKYSQPSYPDVLRVFSDYFGLIDVFKSYVDDSTSPVPFSILFTVW